MTAADDRSQIAEALLHLSFAAQRKTPRVGNDTLPTQWDLLHRQIDDHLTLWQLAGDTQTLPAQAEHDA